MQCLEISEWANRSVTNTKIPSVQGEWTYGMQRWIDHSHNYFTEKSNRGDYAERSARPEDRLLFIIHNAPARSIASVATNYRNHTKYEKALLDKIIPGFQNSESQEPSMVWTWFFFILRSSQFPQHEADKLDWSAAGVLYQKVCVNAAQPTSTAISPIGIPCL